MNDNKHSVIHEFDFSLIGEFFKNLERQGPGSEQVTQLALQLTGINLSEEIKIADIGSGTGGQAFHLAKHTQGTIEALELMPEFVKIFREKVKHSEYSSRINVNEGSMFDLSFEENSLDLIWAEGSIYHIGFEKGLEEWKKFLKPEGIIAVSEASWFTDAPPKEIYDFWNDNYRGIDMISNKIRQMEKAGYKVMAHFILPEESWWNYFNPIRKHTPDFLREYSNNKSAEGLAKMLNGEADLYKKYKDYYGYVFYIGKKIKEKKLNFTIRPEVIEEKSEIYNLIKTAFETANVKDGDEQDFAENLRKGNKYIPELALVAELDNKLIGHIMLTKTLVTNSDGNSFEALLLAPLSVLLEYRNKGVGSELIAAVGRLAKNMGYKAIFLVGDPAYYSRFDFKKTSLYGIHPKSNIPEQYVQVKELIPGALDGISGNVDCC